MAPRSFTLPSAKTESAKAARSAFFCTLCQKGYSRQNEFEAHESSYDHQHKKRLKEMKEMQKQAQPKAKEDKGPLISVKLGSPSNTTKPKSGGAGFKKGGFKNAFRDEDDGVKETPAATDVEMKEVSSGAVTKGEDADSDFTDDEDYYDPARPTGCTPSCPGRLAVVNT